MAFATSSAFSTRRSATAGRQEITDKWLRFGNPWEIPRPEIAYRVKFGGRTEPPLTNDGRFRVRWIPETVVSGVAYDTPILGYRVDTCNLLRLVESRSDRIVRLPGVQHGDYYRAVRTRWSRRTSPKSFIRTTKSPQGKELRLQQQFFFCHLFACRTCSAFTHSSAERPRHFMKNGPCN